MVEPSGIHCSRGCDFCTISGRGSSENRKKGKRISEHVSYAAEAERIEWLFNKWALVCCSRCRCVETAFFWNDLERGMTRGDAWMVSAGAVLAPIITPVKVRSIPGAKAAGTQHSAVSRRCQADDSHVLAHQLGKALRTSKAWGLFAKRVRAELPLSQLRSQRASARRNLILRQASIICRRLRGKQALPPFRNERARGGSAQRLTCCVPQAYHGEESRSYACQLSRTSKPSDVCLNGVLCRRGDT